MPDGRICYIEIPAIDVDASARFFETALGWKSRVRGDGTRAFDDATGTVSGAWVLGRRPAREPGLLAYVMVDSIDASLEKITRAGGEAVTPRTPLSQHGEAFATFRDPAGNLFGLYQQPRR